jgi:hypothetical protein
VAAVRGFLARFVFFFIVELSRAESLRSGAKGAAGGRRPCAQDYGTRGAIVATGQRVVETDAVQRESYQVLYTTQATGGGCLSMAG